MNKHYRHAPLMALLTTIAIAATWLTPALPAILCLVGLGLGHIIARLVAHTALPVATTALALVIAVLTVSATPALSLASYAAAALLLSTLTQRPWAWALLGASLSAMLAVLIVRPPPSVTLEWHTWIALGITALLTLVGLAQRYDSRARLAQAIDRERSSGAKSSAMIREFSAYLPLQATRALKSGKTRTQILHRRRNLVVFFSDIHEFTDRIEEMEPEDAADFLNEYLTDMCRIAQEHGGLVDKFIGDALMITFGDDADSTPLDNAHNCVQMALAMQRHIRVLSEHWSDRSRQSVLKVRMGISAGYCTTGNFGSPERMEYTAIGKQVNLAARLEAMAEPGQILCSYPVWKLLHDRVFFEPAGEIDVKGFARPVSVYAAQGAASAPAVGITGATNAAPGPRKTPSTGTD